MNKYVKPQVSVKKIKLNSFLERRSFRYPISSPFSFFQVGTVFAESGGNISPPDTGTAGLKDKKYSAKYLLQR